MKEALISLLVTESQFKLIRDLVDAHIEVACLYSAVPVAATDLAEYLRGVA